MELRIPLLTTRHRLSLRSTISLQFHGYPTRLSGSMGSGRISNLSDWEYRRQEIGAQIQNYEIGDRPVRPGTITASYSGGVLTVNVTKNRQLFTLTAEITLPSGNGPFPAIIGVAGYVPAETRTSPTIATIAFHHSQVSTYGSPKSTDPFSRLYHDHNLTNTGQYSAWTWGDSRLIDGLELDQNVLPIDLKHLGVIGCSYTGKLALFAGAFDERPALTISQESGGGGYTTLRVSQLRAGDVETLAAIDYNWFSDAMRQFSASVGKLPEDHHMLMTMVAPRAL
jgi:hypothetical protein